jgi:hypothetical protein
MATLCAAPAVVRSTVSEPRLRSRRPRTNWPQGAEIVERALRRIGRQVAPAGLQHAEVAQVAADRRLRDRMTLAAQQVDEFALLAHGGPPQQAEDGVAALGSGGGRRA